MSTETTACDLCGRTSAAPLKLGPLPHRGCLACAPQLGKLIHEAPARLQAVWPLLADDDDGSPEPRVRAADGSSVELRQRTAELKKELSLEKRMELAEMLGELGLHREQLLEAGWVLAASPSPELAQRALDLLFGTGQAAPDALSLLRRHLLPS